MADFKRYGVYYLPPPGPLADFGAAWLGWDAVYGREVAQPPLAGLPRPVAALTERPRRYGFHATLKPPFRLAERTGRAALRAAVAALAARTPPVTLGRLAPCRLGAFLALVPEEAPATLGTLAGRVVADLDAFRAAPSQAELARRRASGLSPRQEAMLARWGYPFVMAEFRFHMTLTGPLDACEAEAVEAALVPVLAPLLSAPVRIGSLALMGEGGDGRFRLLERFALAG